MQFFNFRFSLNNFIIARFAIAFFILIISYSQNCNAQAIKPSDKFILWEGVKIYEFEYAGFPDSLETCYGEWINDGKAKNLNKLSKRTLNKIVMTVKKEHCNIVFVDLRNIWNTKDAWPNGIYCLGLRTKE